MTERQLRALPKVELHRHLDGSIRPETVLDLARHHNLDIDTSDPAALTRRITVSEPADLGTILTAFDTIQKVSCSYEAIRRITFENVEDCVRDGVELAELRFSPVFIALNKTLGNDEIIEGVLDGVAEAMDRYDIQVGLIHIVSRTLDPELNRRSTEDAIAYAQRATHRCADRIVGFDLADREALSEPEDFSDLVALARGAGLGITVHSGEETGPEHVARSVEVLGASRIGHGISARQSPEVMAMLAERGVLLELCPTSNWLTQAVPEPAAHPLPEFRDAGVPVSINSDDPQLMGIDLVNEYAVVQQHFGCDADAFMAMNRDALAASFLPEDITAHVRSKHFA